MVTQAVTSMRAVRKSVPTSASVFQYGQKHSKMNNREDIFTMVAIILQERIFDFLLNRYPMKVGEISVPITVFVDAVSISYQTIMKRDGLKKMIYF